MSGRREWQIERSADLLRGDTSRVLRSFLETVRYFDTGTALIYIFIRIMEIGILLCQEIQNRLHKIPIYIYNVY